MPNARLWSDIWQNVIDWAVANGVRRMVAASSAAVYGNPSLDALPISETQPYDGLSPYAESKYLLRSQSLCTILPYRERQ